MEIPAPSPCFTWDRTHLHRQADFRILSEDSGPTNKYVVCVVSSAVRTEEGTTGLTLRSENPRDATQLPVRITFWSAPEFLKTELVSSFKAGRA